MLVFPQMAAVEVQRVWRGYMGRQRFKRKKTWHVTAPGPDRLKLGMQILTHSKDAYDRQKHEIEALHRAKARAETRISAINTGLQESESELATIQRELSAIDQLEAQVVDLARQESKLKDEMDQLATFATMNADAAVVLSGKNKRLEDLRSLEVGDQVSMRSRVLNSGFHCMRVVCVTDAQRAMADKRAEREIRKQELEAEFAAVFSDIREKKAELKQLEESIGDMESQRLRKDREFNRLQRNLMELLTEQKAELDAIREKGLQLETATATSAGTTSCAFAIGV
jgi:predicted  nucleic acid-binding Zn-ribbon protein